MKKILFLLLCAGFLSSCEREMPEETTVLTDLIKDKNWQVIADSTVSSAGTTVNNYSLLKDCEKDNLYQFKSNKSAWIDEGSTKCNSGDAQSTAIGVWSLNESSKVLTLNSVEKVDFKINSLSSSQMVLVSTESINGVTFTETTTFKVK